MEIAAIIIGILLNIVSFFLRPVLKFITKNKKAKVPPVKNPLLLKSAKQLAENIRNQEVTSKEVLQAYIERVKEVNPVINAVVEERFATAIKEAEAVDAFLRSTDKSKEELAQKKPLLGVPLTVKESCSLEGMQQTLGSKSLAGNKAKADGDPVSKLKRAGAIPILVSNTPEYCLSWFSTNGVTGTTNNPYDTTRTCGGSSGGEGALIGAGASLLGVGSDLGGSIRIPAAFCGVFGHKPTQGIVSIENHMPAQKSKGANGLLNVGPLCRYAEDLPVMLKVMSGDDNNKFGLDENVDLSNINVYYMETASNPITSIGVQIEIQQAVKKAVRHLRDTCNCKIKLDKFADLAKGFFISIPGIIYYDYHNPEIETGVDPKTFNAYKELWNLAIGKSEYSFPLVYFHAINQMTKSIYSDRIGEFKKMADDLREEIKFKLGTNGVLICPNFPMAAPYHQELSITPLGLMYTMVYNVLGFPCTAVPMGMDKDGLPISIQVVGAPEQDKLCIAVAKELSKIGGWVPPS